MPDAQGSVSPINTSSSQHEERSDNYVEYYVKGGEKKMTDDGLTPKTMDRKKISKKIKKLKKLRKSYKQRDMKAKASIAALKKAKNNIGVTSTPDRSYSVPEGTTTEPDPQSQLAMQKGSCCDDCKGSACDGNCCKLALCNMAKAACTCCDNCGSDCKGDCCEDCSVTNKAASTDDDNDADSESDDDDDDTSIKKNSEWNSVFIPFIPSSLSTKSSTTVRKFLS